MGKILLVDDYPEVCHILTDEFTERGHQVTSFSMCQDLLDKIEAFKPEVMILGVDRPRNRWYHLLSAIRRFHYNLPVILFTSSDQFKNEPIAIMADYVVLKSSEIASLNEKVIRAIQANENPGAAPVPVKQAGVSEARVAA